MRSAPTPLDPDSALTPARRARVGMLRLKYAALSYGFGALVLLLSAAMGLLPWWTVLVQVVYHWTGLAVFALWLRSGRAARLAEPTLAFPQLWFAVSAIVLCYALTPQARGAALQILCLALVFNMRRVSPAQISAAAWGALGLMTLLSVASWQFRWVAFNLTHDVLNLLMAAIQLPALSFVARRVREMRQRQLEQRQTLESTLDRLQTLLQHDSLTGLFNRRHMNELLDMELKRLARSGRPFCVAIIDIDLFKQINDRFGHQVGDDVLRQFAVLARRHLHPAHAMARWGGEEFLLLMPEQGLDASASEVDALRQTLADYPWNEIAPGLSVTFSAGLAEYGSQPESLHRLLERADRQLYAAKAGGRNRVHVARQDAA